MTRVRARAPEGWDEVFSGTCVEASVVQALLEGSGLNPVTQQFSPEVWWAGSVLEDCRIYVPEAEAETARELLENREPRG